MKNVLLQIIYSKLSDLLPAEVMAEDDQALERPDAEELEETTDRTRQALERLTQTKIAAAMPVRCAEKTVSGDIDHVCLYSCKISY